MDPVEPGLACGSDTAHLSLLGYDPRVYYRGRGAFESMGAGLAMAPGDIAFKDESTGIIVSRRADRHFEEEGPILCAVLDGMKLPSFPGYEVRVRYATEHRCGVVKGPKLSEEAKNTAAVINELSKEITRILVSHPINAKRTAEGKNIANVVLLRGCGIRIEVPAFEIKHGLAPCMAIDDAGHDKAIKLKVLGLEAVDQAIGQLARILWEAERSGQYQYFLCVTGDHSTPVEYGDHSFEPVPFALCRLRDFIGAIGEDNVMSFPLDDFPLPSVKSGEDVTENIDVAEHKSDQRKAFCGNSVCEFSEIAAARGCLGRFPRSEMMGIIKKFIKAKND
ncbi:hypothetical protein GUJ93_ZPchr0012g21300 [Zizania palustris]|uniref:Metalloenzyme domain-containing protein n=1 Tax=Zizania palustris TaxID=103762 RepID=A0A8J6BQL7_ZIZPA|nr:hypothetical protein GUJ93_ZPchr0012g21300 [Zizania palustris]